MTHTYLESLSTSRDKLRLNIGDTQTNAGPRPDNRNFSDAEISYILTQEDDRLNGATAFVFELLASEWESYSISEGEGEAQFDAKNKAADFDKRAAIWRKKPGGQATEDRSTNVVVLTRTDAWTTAANSEYS